MAMSHANCDHPSTPAARAKCRRRQETIAGVVEDARIERGQMVPEPTASRRGARVTPQPRQARTRTLRAPHDLVDVPAAFGAVIRWAWEHDLPVGTAEPYNDHERRVIIASDHGWLTLVWKDQTPYGVHASWWRPKGSSVATRLMAVNVGLDRLNGDVE